MSRFRFVTIFLIFHSWNANLFACSVPVFRFALERWKPSVYEVLVFHRGPLSKEDKQQTEILQKYTLEANIDLTIVDLSKRPDATLKVLWKQFGSEKDLPQLVIRSPNSNEETVSTVHGKLSSIKLDSLFKSPIQQKIIDLLGKGETSVFVLLPGEDSTENLKRKKLLQSELELLFAG